MPQRLLLDTDVLIDYLRGRPEAVDYLEALTPALLVSAVTVAELCAGVRDGDERSILDEFVQSFDVIPLEKQIAVTAGLIRRDYGKSHGTGLADAIIAATAQIQNADLVTLNRKHFPMVRDIVVPYQKA